MKSPSRKVDATPWSFITFAGVIATLYFTREILIPLAFALTLTFLLAPAVGQLERLRLSRLPSVIVVMALSLTAAGFVSWVILNQLVDVATQLPQYRMNIRSKMETIRHPATGALGRAADSVKEIGKELIDPEFSSSTPSPSNDKSKPPKTNRAPIPVEIVDRSTNALTYLRNFIRPFIAPISMTFIVVIFTIFMLMKREDLRNRFLRLAGIGQLNLMTQALDDAANRVSRYLVMLFAVNAGFGALFAVGLYFIGVPNAALWGAVAAILRIVPYVGTLVGAGLPFVLSLAVFDGWVQPALVAGQLFILELVVANFLEPWLYGAHTGISSLALLVSTVFWTVLWGPSGLILSTPLTVCVVVLGRYVPQLAFLHILLGDEPVLSPEAHLYQRLLAMDQQESRAVVDQFLTDHTLTELYDLVLVPALIMAEQDRHKGALDDTRERFIFLTVNEMVAELFDFQAGNPENSAETYGKLTAPPPPPPAGQRVLCVPANDEADEIVAGMLAQLLEREGCVALSFPLGSSATDMLALMEPSADDVICISALPPFAVTHARNMCSQVRSHFPNAKILVGVWGFPGDVEKAMVRFRQDKPNEFVASLTSAIAWVRDPSAPVPRQRPTENVTNGLVSQQS